MQNFLAEKATPYFFVRKIFILGEFFLPLFLHISVEKQRRFWGKVQYVKIPISFHISITNSKSIKLIPPALAKPCGNLETYVVLPKNGLDWIIETCFEKYGLKRFPIDNFFAFLSSPKYCLYLFKTESNSFVFEIQSDFLKQELS